MIPIAVIDIGIRAIKPETEKAIVPGVLNNSL
ncbi:conserved hypothetical protein [Vibrio nigripulchritudo SOn1]|uniref:Uncharacterized protein n=1 Tax=Vibrio nigripulchritudo SOn1 TaxID=1238450 RepID=A0AAV2VKX6_9VIBR|nr:conserved hypothetical protein [Vibrio nigripulchritudo SOn1]